MERRRLSSNSSDSVSSQGSTLSSTDLPYEDTDSSGSDTSVQHPDDDGLITTGDDGGLTTNFIFNERRDYHHRTDDSTSEAVDQPGNITVNRSVNAGFIRNESESRIMQGVSSIMRRITLFLSWLI